MKIEDMGLPRRLTGALRRMDADTAEDVAGFSRLELLLQTGIGIKGLEQIDQALAANGLVMKVERKSWVDRFPPMPEGFRDRFIKQGWRGVERVYGARREVIQRWIAQCGGPAQLAEARKAYLAEIKAQKTAVRRKGR